MFVEHYRSRNQFLSPEVREMIVKCHQENRIKSEFSKIFGIPGSTIESIIKKFELCGSVENRSGSGRRQLFLNRDQTKLLRKRDFE